MKTIVTAITIMLFITVFANTSFAAITIYMKLVDNNGRQIMGESIAKGYENWVEVLALGDGAQSPITFTGGTGAGAGKVTINDLSFQGQLSSASLPLQAMMYKGVRLNSVDIAFVYAQSQCTCPYYKIHLENVYIAGLSGSAAGENVTQQITFTPLLLAWAYYKQDPKTGIVPTTPTSQFAWDRNKNTVWAYLF